MVDSAGLTDETHAKECQKQQQGDEDMPVFSKILLSFSVMVKLNTFQVPVSENIPRKIQVLEMERLR